jgi:putative oxidoreductase
MLPQTSISPYLLCFSHVFAAVLFFQHGAQKLFGFAGSRVVPLDDLQGTQRGIAGLLETVGPVLLGAGLFTRFTAFVLCGEIAVAYFVSWSPRGFWPIANGGEEAVLFCYLVPLAGLGRASAWSVDVWLRGLSWRPRRLAWEPHARAVLRFIVGFIIVQHGARKAFGLLAVVGGRTGAPPVRPGRASRSNRLHGCGDPRAADVGLFTRQPLAVIAPELFAASVFVAAPRGVWPIRNGGIEALLMMAILAYFVACGAGAWSVDRLRTRRPQPEDASASAA